MINKALNMHIVFPTPQSELSVMLPLPIRIHVYWWSVINGWLVTVIKGWMVVEWVKVWVRR